MSNADNSAKKLRFQYYLIGGGLAFSSMSLGSSRFSTSNYYGFIDPIIIMVYAIAMAISLRSTDEKNAYLWKPMVIAISFSIVYIALDIDHAGMQAPNAIILLTMLRSGYYKKDEDEVSDGSTSTETPPSPPDQIE